MASSGRSPLMSGVGGRGHSQPVSGMATNGSPAASTMRCTGGALIQVTAWPRACNARAVFK